MRGADILVECLKQDGQDVIFALSGNQIMPIFDALTGQEVRLIHTRHEAATGFMAEGYAQTSGKVGIALVTAGAGLGNSIAPLMTAMASQTPLLLISGDSPASFDGKGAFQEMDQIALTSPVTKKSVRISNVNDLGREVNAALELARSGIPGPVHVSVPVDVLDDNGSFAPVSPPAKEIEPDAGFIIEAINSASRPLILAGPSLAPFRTGQQFGDNGPPVIVMESPRGANDPALGAFKQCWSEADLVIALDKPVDFSVGFGAEDVWPNAEWIGVYGCSRELARAEQNLGTRLIASRRAETSSILRAILGTGIDKDDQRKWRSEVHRLCAVKPDKHGGTQELTSQSLCEAVQQVAATAKNPVIVCDGGEFGQWAQAVVRFPKRVINGIAGAIGGGICHAIGAKVASPGSDVFLLMGDGTAGFHFAEFETAAREEIAINAIIGNDRRWNAEHQLQLNTYGEDRTHSCSLSPARYDLAAEGLGCSGFYVTQPDQLDGALAKAVAGKMPACINVEIEGLPAPAGYKG